MNQIELRILFWNEVETNKMKRTNTMVWVITQPNSFSFFRVKE